MKEQFLSISHKGYSGQVAFRHHRTGKKGRPTLVFLHEGLGAAASFRDLPETLGALTSCDAFAYSRLGYGRSSPLTRERKINIFHIEGLYLLPQVLRAAGIETYILLGHSDGGSIALIHGGGAVCPGLCGIFTLAAHVFCEPLTLKGVKTARANYQQGGLKAKLLRIHGQNTEAAFFGWCNTWLSPGFVHWNIEKYLKFIQVPVMAVQGIDDPYGTLSQLKAIQAGAGRCQIQVIDQCGHIPHLEQPETTRELMAEFLTQVLPQTRQN